MRYRNTYAPDRVEDCADRIEALQQLIDETMDAWDLGVEPPYLYTAVGDERIDLMDEAMRAIADDCLMLPGPEITERLSGRQLGV